MTEREGRPPNESTLERLRRLVCPHAATLSILFSVLVVFTLLSIASVVALPPSHSSYYPAVFSVVLDGTLVVVLAVLLYQCRQFNRTV